MEEPAERSEDGAVIAARTPKSEQTRNLIVETALRLFGEQGYERTTMRSIAREAGVSVGNAYYYFSSKEHLVQGFYDRIQDLHVAAAAEVLATESDFADRLRGVLLCWLDIATPYHEFAGQFFRNAADPTSPLSPFSAESQPARDANIALQRRVMEGSTARLDPEVRAELPSLMWLYHMAVVLFWVHDRTPGQSASRMLVNRTMPMVRRLVRMSRLRVFRSMTLDGVRLFRDLGWVTESPAR